MEKLKLIQKKIRHMHFFILIVLVFFIYQSSAYSGVENVKPAKRVFKFQPKESFEVRNGRIIYLEHCAPCHGDTGKGDGKYYASSLEPKPRDFTNSGFMKQVKDEYLIEVIEKGTAAFGKSPYCPPWGETLKEEEKISNIVAFLRTLYKETDVEKSDTTAYEENL
jgi:mono/diheme cytochrome c family protein